MIKLLSSLPELRNLTAAMVQLASLAPHRLTLGQMTFFIEAAIADLSGSPASIKEILDRAGPSISRNIATTYKVFLDADEHEPKRQGALGWLSRDVDEQDNRRRYLRLTPKGHQIIEELMKATQQEREAA